MKSFALENNVNTISSVEYSSVSYTMRQHDLVILIAQHNIQRHTCSRSATVSISNCCLVTLPNSETEYIARHAHSRNLIHVICVCTIEFKRYRATSVCSIDKKSLASPQIFVKQLLRSTSLAVCR